MEALQDEFEQRALAVASKGVTQSGKRFKAEVVSPGEWERQDSKFFFPILLLCFGTVSLLGSGQALSGSFYRSILFKGSQCTVHKCGM